ncbi:MAG: acyltransferase family protein [Janthinobacterium lividum]
MLLVMALGCLMLPMPLSMDIRGWQETYPLNGPGWSLFFEYIVNILYAVLVRKFSKLALGILVALSAAALLHLTLARPEGDVVGGWALEPVQLHIGFTRVMYPFFAGLLLYRTSKPGRVNNAFFWSSLLVIVVLAMPRLGGLARPWVNGLYESLSIILVFPLIILLGASGELVVPYTKKLCKFLGDISYPIYITHYPLIYIYTAWVYNHKVPLRAGWPFAMLTFFSAIALAYAALKFYDEPARAWLQKKLAAPAAQSHQPGVAVP